MSISRASTLRLKFLIANAWHYKEMRFGTEESQAYVREVISKLNEGV